LPREYFSRGKILVELNPQPHVQVWKFNAAELGKRLPDDERKRRRNEQTDGENGLAEARVCSTRFRGIEERELKRHVP
jgi:hypothetical protein